MSKFDKQILETIDKLSKITDEIISHLENKKEDEDFAEKINDLYQSRKPLISDIDDYIREEDNYNTILDNKEDWKKLMDKVREKDEKALGLLKDNVNKIERELIEKQKQKSVLRYKEHE